jgi:ABC-type polysaccharide/polyol phosphate transport system ATPase subunit
MSTTNSTNSPVIEVKALTKEYRLGQLYNFIETIKFGLARVQGKTVPKRATHKALDNVSFQVAKGEVVGIIGTNGAGKSTLLKHLAKVTRPTEGTIRVEGSVAPLIELGAGLVPELTGRENIYLNGSILGVARKTIRKKLDEIIEFAELEEFIDTPIKRYSSGMKVRLGFSIATSIEADVLIVDEVLAVGDLAFQRKCFDRMEDLIKRRGSTVLLVSHNIRQVERLCTRVILLDSGMILADGVPAEVCDIYYKQSNEKISKYQHQSLASKVNIHSSGEIELMDISIVDENDIEVEAIESGGMLRVRIRFEVRDYLKSPEIVVGTHTTDFLYLSAGSTAAIPERPDYPPGIHEIEYIVPNLPFANGTYCIRFAVFDRHRRKVFGGETLKVFNVTSTGAEFYEAPLRNLDLRTEWKLDGKRYRPNDANLSKSAATGQLAGLEF